MPKDREILKGLDELLDGAGNKFGPILLDELQERLSIVVKKFDIELKEILELSFKKYHTQRQQLKMLLDQSVKPTKKNQNQNQNVASFDDDIPEFIKKFDEKQSN